MAKRVVEEKIQITGNTSGITSTAVAAGAALSEFLSYTIPNRSQLILNPTDFIALYLADATGEIATQSRVVAAITDPMGRRERVIADSDYTVFKEFQDATKKHYVGQRIVIPADFILKLKCAPVTNSIATANRRLALSATLVYETLD